jgi:two-component system CheB/CheR fusion protein
VRSRIESGPKVRLGGTASFDVGLEVVRRLVAQHGATVLEYDVRGQEICVDLRLPVRPVVRRFDPQLDQCQGSAESCRQLQLTFQSLRMRLRAERIEQRALLARLRRSLGVSVTFDDVSRYQQLQQDLEHSDQELETAMEKLQSTNGEMQAKNEGLETMYEQLHATNEALETMNEELQATNEELHALNEEFCERSAKLDQLKAFLEESCRGFE